VYDIILGKYATNIGAFKTPSKAVVRDQTRLSGLKPLMYCLRMKPIQNRLQFVNLKQIQNCWQRRTVHNIFIKKAKSLREQSVQQTSGTMNLIAFIFYQNYGTSVEEMEAASVAQIVSQFNVPFIGIRVFQ
jgi:adenosylhomocysteine nucleosidase